jgi:chloride channel 7
MYEFPLFVFLGVIGGVLGSIFTWTNIKVSQLRSKFLHRTKLFRMIEVVLITTACSAVWFYICFLATCREKNDAQRVKQSLVSFTCTSSSYNEYASLFLVPPENAVRHLFGRGSATEFGLASTGVFAAIYLIFACYTAGTSMATGLFVPMIIVGAAYGRFFGIVCKLIFPSLELDPGTYALIGASSFMGGVTRMTISLTVILLEITNGKTIDHDLTF